MEDELVENNLANDDWDAVTGTYDELKAGNNRDIGSGPNDISGIMLNNGDSNIANNSSQDMSTEDRMGGKYRNPNLWGTDNLIDKMGDNMAIAESRVDDKPLRTEKTAELESKDEY